MLIEEVKHLLTQAKTKKALNYIIVEGNIGLGDLKNEIILLKSNLIKNERDRSLGLITYEVAEVNERNIRLAILNYILPQLNNGLNENLPKVNDIPILKHGTWWSGNSQNNQESKLFWNTKARESNKYHPDLLSRFESFLKEGLFIEADIEFFNLLKSYSIKGREQLTRKEIESISLRVLYECDQLWTYYSDNKYGLSVQYSIWRDINDDPRVFRLDTFKKFGEKVGWDNKKGWLSSYGQIKDKLDVSSHGFLPSYRNPMWDNQTYWFDAWKETCLGVMKLINLNK